MVEGKKLGELFKQIFLRYSSAKSYVRRGREIRKILRILIYAEGGLKIGKNYPYVINEWLLRGKSEVNIQLDFQFLYVFSQFFMFNKPYLGL